MKDFIKAVKQVAGMLVVMTVLALIVAIPILLIVYQLKKFWFFITL